MPWSTSRPRASVLHQLQEPPHRRQPADPAGYPVRRRRATRTPPPARAATATAPRANGPTGVPDPAGSEFATGLGSVVDGGSVADPAAPAGAPDPADPEGAALPGPVDAV